MQWKLGDFVRFVDERREGYVTRIFDTGMVGVTGDDDFEIPVPANKVVAVHGREPSPAGSKVVADDSVAQQTTFVAHGVYLALINDAKSASVVHFHLVNETSYQLPTTLVAGTGDDMKGEYAGIIQPASHVKIYSAQLADLQLWPQVALQALFYTTVKRNIPTAINFSQKFKAKDLAGAKKPVPLVGQPGWLIRLDEPELVINAEKLKESFFKPAAEKLQTEQPQKEVDLHIEQVRDDHQFLQPAEMMRYQLDHFNKMLDAAIVHKLPELIVIHGAGNGILRHEIHKQLGKHAKVATFMDARKEKFGYGATRVILK